MGARLPQAPVGSALVEGMRSADDAADGTMTTVDTARRPAEPRPSRWPYPVRAVGRFLYPSAHILLPGALILAVVLAVGAVVGYRQATDIATHGQRITAVQTLVYVGDGGCRGGCTTINGVQAYTPATGWLLLTSLYGDRGLPRTAPHGWQDSSPATGYQPPLPLYVLHLPGGQTEAMSVGDVRTARTHAPAERLIGALLLLLAFGAAIGPYVRKVKANRATQRPPSVSVATTQPTTSQTAADHEWQP